MNTKQLDKLEAQILKENTGAFTAFSGVYYPTELEARVMTNDKCLLINRDTTKGNREFRSGRLNDGQADLIGATSFIDMKFPDYLMVIPKEVKETYKIELPDYFTTMSKTKLFHVFLDLNTGSLSLNRTSADQLGFNGNYLAHLGGSTIYMGVNGLNNVVMIWDETPVYNPFLNQWSFAVMPLKTYGKNDILFEKIDSEFGISKVG